VSVRAGDPRAIGVFDSGVGGLTVLSELHRRLPNESTVYLGDNARAPYGPRDADEVRRFTLEGVDWLLRQDPKLLVLACNTATSQALDAVRAASPVPVLGVVRPGAVAAAASTRVGRVGVIATAGTVRSGAYPAAIDEAQSSIVVSQQACPDLVPLVEAGQTDDDAARAAVAGYLGELLLADPGIDTLLLGCTHYPVLRPLIEEIVGRSVAVVDSAFTTALAAEDLLDALTARRVDLRPPTRRIASTGDLGRFSAVARLLADGPLPPVEAAELASD
jgi:glutamate racemase